MHLSSARKRSILSVVPRATVAAVCTLGLAACGSSYGSATTGSSPSAAGATGTAVSVEALNYQFSPTALVLPASTLVTMTIKNASSSSHNFSISEYAVSKDIAPGVTETVTFTTRGDASVQFFCRFHRDTAGMVGTARIGAGGAAPASPPTPATRVTPYYNPYG